MRKVSQGRASRTGEIDRTVQGKAGRAARNKANGMAENKASKKAKLSEKPGLTDMAGTQCPVQKKEILTLKIEAMSSDGAGIGRVKGFALFVKNTVPGDLIKAQVIYLKKSFGIAKLLQVLEGSPERVRPACAIAGKCGGCQIMQMGYRAQLRAKENKVKDCLTRIGGFDLAQVDFTPILGMDDPLHYRNKEQVPVGAGADGKPVFGFFAEHSHHIVPLPEYDCLLGEENNARILKAVRSWMLEYKIAVYDEETQEGLIRHVLIRTAKSGETLVCLVAAKAKVPHLQELTETLLGAGIATVCLNIQPEPTNVILGRTTKVIAGKGYITDRIGDLSFQVSPNSFFQVNRTQTEKLYEKALEFAHLTGGETVWDLYCGIGTISLFLARKAGHVYGVEIVPQAVEDARRNAAANQADNVTFFTGEAEKIVPEFYAKNAGASGKELAGALPGEKELGKVPGAKVTVRTASEVSALAIRPDVMVVDPPRKGCAKQLLDTMVQMQPERIVYVSCDPATLARDLKLLAQEGYRLERVQPVDMFPETMHVETVVLLSKVQK